MNRSSAMSPIACELRGLRVEIYPFPVARPMPFGHFRSMLEFGGRLQGRMIPRSLTFPLLDREDAAAFHRAGFLVQQTTSGRPGQLIEAVPRISVVNRPDPAGGAYPSMAEVNAERRYIVSYLFYFRFY